MSTIPGSRPTGITVTAWAWIATGGLMLLSSLMGGAAFVMMQRMGAPPIDSAELPAGAVLVFRYFGLMLAIQGALALLAIFAGIALLKLQAWGRTTLEILSWLSLLYTLGFGVFWIYSWLAMTSGMPATNAPVDLNVFSTGGAVMGGFITLLFAVPFGLMIRYLRGAEARNAVSKR